MKIISLLFLMTLAGCAATPSSNSPGGASGRKGDAKSPEAQVVALTAGEVRALTGTQSIDALIEKVAALQRSKSINAASLGASLDRVAEIQCETESNSDSDSVSACIVSLKERP